MSISKQSWLISISLQHGGVTHTEKLKFGNRTTYTKAIYIQKNASITEGNQATVVFRFIRNFSWTFFLLISPPIWVSSVPAPLSSTNLSILYQYTSWKQMSFLSFQSRHKAVAQIIWVTVNIFWLSQQVPIDSKPSPTFLPIIIEEISIHIRSATRNTKNRCWADSFSILGSKNWWL